MSQNITWEDIIPILDTNSIKECNKCIPDIYVELDTEPILMACKNIMTCINGEDRDSNFAISISGGVDSMVVAYAFNHLRMRFPEEQINIVAIHIDYDNRNTSKYDAELCKYWCAELDIPLCVRKITEIHRSRNKDRDIYESVTRDIRYGMYKLLDKHIILGHNKDDAIENIFANIIKQKNYNNLLGMTESSSMTFTDYKIIRPMLSISKKDIYEFARKYSIPYVYDSTPDWSERGLKRDVLIPFLHKFDKRLIPGLEQFVSYVSSIQSVFQITVDNLINYRVGGHMDLKNGVKEPICTIDNSIINYDTMVLKSVLSEICKHYSLPYISQKGIINTYKLLIGGRCGKIILNKCLFLQRTENIDVYLIK
jgi:tRNA(Ile)-lysidine synthetase-like protein